MKPEQCVECRFFKDIDLTSGECRAYPPTLTGFPVVGIALWCGKHQLIIPEVINPKKIQTKGGY